MCCLYVRAEGANLCRKFASASYTNFDTLFLGVPKRVPKITHLTEFKLTFRDPKKIDFFEKVAQKNLLDNNDILAPKAPYLKGDFAEGEILPQPFPA